jgi:hypothetical protein
MENAAVRLQRRTEPESRSRSNTKALEIEMTARLSLSADPDCSHKSVHQKNCGRFRFSDLGREAIIKEDSEVCEKICFVGS